MAGPQKTSRGSPPPALTTEVDVSEHVHRLEPGMQMFLRYQLQRILGRGGMGVVWLARDTKLDRDVALKFLPEVFNQDLAAQDDLKRETRRSLELTHPHIVRIYDFVEDPEAAAISMEFVDGASLSNLRVKKEQRAFEIAELTDWVKQLCEALDYAHSKAKVVHRDLKPANLMVSKLNDIKVADFGISRSINDSLSRTTAKPRTSGTLPYMSPQQLMGEPASPLDDLYSMGATVYELLTSKPPFHTGEIAAQVVDKRPPSLSQRRRELQLTGGSIPPEWEEVIAACLAKDPVERPQSAAEISERLGLIPKTTRRKQDRETPVPGSRKPSLLKRRRVWIGLLIATFTIGLLVALAGGLGALGWYFGLHKMFAPPGGVIVRTIPDGAIATLGGEDAQPCPATFKGLRAGKYRLRITLTGYDTVEREVEVKEKEFLDTGPIELVRTRGQLHVTSEPGALEVFDGDKSLGTTPLKLDLIVGTHTLTARFGVWGEKRMDAVVSKEKPASLHFRFETGTVTIKSQPAGAMIKLNGKEMGKTPLNAFALPVGDYQMELALAGFQSNSQKIRVVSGQAADVSLRLVNPREERWSKARGRYQGTLTNPSDSGNWLKLDIRFSGDYSSPIMDYTKQFCIGELDFPSTSTCSNDPKNKSRFLLTVRRMEDGAITLVEKDKYFMVGDVNHKYIFKFSEEGMVTLTYMNDMDREPTATLNGTLQKTE